jgi:transposase
MGALGTTLAAAQSEDGKVKRDHRPVMNGLLWINRNGTPWRDLRSLWPVEDGGEPLLRLAQSRRLGPVLRAVRGRADGSGKPDWTTHYVDSTAVRAHYSIESNQ